MQIQVEASISCPVDKFTYVFCEHLSLESGNEDNIYVSSGKEIKCFDVRLATTKWEPLENYNYNKEEINKCLSNGSTHI
ncbi:cellulose synthase (UDP-forming) [Trifolium repens]|nr:cellulose synthase (UDP-forming) [Trifolium repens]